MVPDFLTIAEAGALMTEASEQTIDGLVVHGSPKYLTDLLRDELRFDGVVIGNDLRSLIREHVAGTAREAATETTPGWPAMASSRGRVLRRTAASTWPVRLRRARPRA